MRRILVGGSSGSGKTTMAGRLAALLDLPYVEVDSLFHGPGWVPREQFVDDVDTFTAQPAWIIDHDYGAARHLVWPRLDTFVWLDYPRWLTEARVIRRSVGRGLLHRELWNGNHESVLTMFRDPEHPVRWSWVHHARKRSDFAARIASPANRHVKTYRFGHPREAAAWLCDLSGRHRQTGARPS